MQHYSTATAAQRINCGRATINRAIADKVLPATDVSRPGTTKPRWRIREDDLLAFGDRLRLIKLDEPVEATA